MAHINSRPNSMAGPPLKALKDKMHALKQEVDDYREQSEKWEKDYKTEKLEKEKCEEEIKGFTRRIQLLEDDLDRTQTKLDEAVLKLEDASKTADESERGRRSLENKSYLDEGRMEKLEQALKHTEQIANEAEVKYEEAARKLLVVESNLDRAEDQLADYQKRIQELETENYSATVRARSYESDVNKASQREDSYEETIRDLTQRLKDRELRMEELDRENQRLKADLDLMEKRYEDSLDQYNKLRQETEAAYAEFNDLV